MDYVQTFKFIGSRGSTQYTILEVLCSNLKKEIWYQPSNNLLIQVLDKARELSVLY